MTYCLEDGYDEINSILEIINNVHVKILLSRWTATLS